ncbi:hypothetical protein LTR56_026688 [Elasticomyces elasticus]|nr:hypothetical protein LTR56_026688 [Elasticomyces elasticus]
MPTATIFLRSTKDGFPQGDLELVNYLNEQPSPDDVDEVWVDGHIDRDVGAFVPPLQSVLIVPESADGTPDPLCAIKLFHLSFRDFLVSPDLAKDDEGKKFWIDEAQAHSKLAGHCLRMLSDATLNEDMCRVKALGTRRAAASKTKIAEHLPEEVAYACSYWVQHVVKSGEHIKDDGEVHQFLKKHLLHWIEVLSWLGKASDVIHSLRALQSIVNADQGEKLISMLEDASRLALRNRYIIDEAPLQISARANYPSLPSHRDITVHW